MIKNKLLFISILLIINNIIYADILKLDLDGAINLAISNNIDIQISKLTHNLKRRSYWLSFSQFFPQFSTDFSFANMVLYNIEDDYSNIYSDSYKNTIKLSVDQLVFDGGESIAGTFLKYYEINLQSKELLEKEDNLKVDVELLYSNVIFLGNRIHLQENKINALEKEILIAKVNLELQLITQLDYKDILLQKTEALIEFSKYKREYEFAVTNLKELCGIESDIILTSKLDVYDIEIPENKIDELIKLSEINNINSNSLRLKMVSSKTNQVMTYLSLLPKINTNFSYIFEGADFPLYKKSWNLSFNLSWAFPIFPINMKESLEFPIDDKSYIKKIDTTKEMLGMLKNDTNIKYFSNLNSINKFEESNIALYKSKLEYEKFTNDIKKNLKQQIKEYNETVKLYKLGIEKQKLLEEKQVILEVSYKVGKSLFLDIIKNKIEIFSNEIDTEQRKNDIYKKFILIKNIASIKKEDLYEIIK